MSNEILDLVKKASAKTDFLNAEQEKDLLIASKQGDTKATETLFRANSRFLLKEALRYSKNFGLPLEDCFSACCEGLLKSIKKYDCKQTTRLITLSSFWLRSCCQDELYRSHFIKIPHNKLGLLKVEDKNKYYVSLMNASAEIASLDAPLGEDEDSGNLYENISSLSSLPEIEFEMSELKQIIESAMKANLSEREIFVLKMHFGFFDGESHSLSDIGRRLGCSKQRADQIKSSALKKLRHPRVCYQLKDYIA